MIREQIHTEFLLPCNFQQVLMLTYLPTHIGRKRSPARLRSRSPPRPLTKLVGLGNLISQPCDER